MKTNKQILVSMIAELAPLSNVDKIDILNELAELFDLVYEEEPPKQKARSINHSKPGLAKYPAKEAPTAEQVVGIFELLVRPTKNEILETLGYKRPGKMDFAHEFRTFERAGIIKNVSTKPGESKHYVLGDKE
jgi:hypothetical protein